MPNSKQLLIMGLFFFVVECSLEPISKLYEIPHPPLRSR